MLKLSRWAGIPVQFGARAGCRLRQAMGALLAVGLMAGLSSGCALLEGIEAQSQPQVEPAPAPQPQAAPSQPQEPAARPRRRDPEPVAIVYTAGVPVYQATAAAIAARSPGPARLIPLSQDDGALSAEAVRGYPQVVAVGAAAARSALELPAKQVVFCQVFNYREHGLARDGVIGVSMLPPPTQQFRAWKALAPELKRIGVISGAGHDDLIEAARTAARAQDADLVHREVRTDKEALYEFKRMVPDIDGFWLLPDERVLSHRVLREIMEYGVKHRKLILSFTPELLRFGAVMSVSSRETDVAERVVTALRMPNAAERQPFQLLPLWEASIEVNRDVAHRIGYALPSPTGSQDDAQ